MKILCLSIHSDNNYPGMPKWKYSLAFSYLKAYLSKSDYYNQLRFIDLNYYENDSWMGIVKDIFALPVDILAISCYVWNIKMVIQILSEIRVLLPDIKVILGGPEFSSNTISSVEKYGYADFVVIGEGEITFKELIDYLMGKNPTPIHNLKGIRYRDLDNQMVENEPRKIIKDLKEIPSPFLLGIIKNETVKKGLVALESQRGCIQSCGYCNYQKGFGKIRYFPIKRVLKELDLVRSFEPKQIYLMDPSFNSNRLRAKTILSSLIDMNQFYQSKIRLNSEMIPDMLDTEIIELSKAAGMTIMEAGVQTLNKNALKLMGRYRDEDKMFKNIQISSAIGINVVPQIIYGLPGDNVDSFYRTFDAVYDTETKYMDIFHLLILPGTRYSKEAQEFGLVFEQDPPHRIIESRDFSKAEIDFLELFRKLVLSTLQLKPTIKTITKSLINMKYHDIFIGYLNETNKSLFDFQWPIHSKNDRNNALSVINHFSTHLLNRYNLSKTKIIKDLDISVRMAQIELSSHFAFKKSIQ